MASTKKPRPALAANGEPVVTAAAKGPRPARMTKVQLERRVAELEEEVSRLKAALEEKPASDQLGWRRMIGIHADAPEAFDEAMRLGREWRESFRPKPRRRKSKKSSDGHS